MGPGIAVSLALGGVWTTVLSRSEEGAAAGLAKAKAQLAQLEENALGKPAAIEWARRHLAASADFDGTIAKADLVIESAPEDMVFKQELFARLGHLAKPDAVLATNTSGLSVTEVSRNCQRPERVLTTHFWNPPHLMRLVEIVRGEKTGQETVTAMRDLLESCGKTVVIVNKDRPGQLGNRLQLAMAREAVHIVAEGIASVEDVDKAVKAGFGSRMPVYGIFEHADAVGLDMVLSVMDYISQDLYSEPKAPDILRKKVSQGQLGTKTGQGFYDWSGRDPQAVTDRRDRFLLQLLKSEFAGQGE